ncbi:hypothetical protein CYLTODRAFT_344295 [Cylindrobasidium torrendii FP15055 ss-10]|uniref:Uncharacterized protein n=1 Tax=Cylindrobasidium torrendii FP15055 ss-10 TaxID=1314674 RepID=A0A0D7BP52_9AGAR|nr:hypothetical protein CYLTODRAFT_344295 [Cylindrobasidium torrendii FP15055 ss-10]
MPSYEERKKLQEKYQIDRRHLYDYLHSRGLRVRQEDKYGNLPYRKKQTKAHKPAKVSPLGLLYPVFPHCSSRTLHLRRPRRPDREPRANVDP